MYYVSKFPKMHKVSYVRKLEFTWTMEANKLRHYFGSKKIHIQKNYQGKELPTPIGSPSNHKQQRKINR